MSYLFLMNDWLPAITSTTVLAVVGAVLSVPYRRMVEGAVSSKFDSDLERLRTEFRREEEGLRADIRKGEQDVSALRSGALTNMAARHLALAQRRILALEAVWTCAISMGKFKWGVEVTKILKMNEVLSRSGGFGSEASKIREFMKLIAGKRDLSELGGIELPDKERPFVPPLVWAVFAAYRMVLCYPIVFFAMVETGAGAGFMAGPEKMMDMLKAVLPHQSVFIDEHREASFSFLADELEERLLALIREALDNPLAEANTVEEAARIIAAVEAARQQTVPESSPGP